MNEANHCQACGADLGADSGPDGLCPRCLLRLALPEGRREPPAGEDPRQTRTEFWTDEPSETIGPYRLLHKIGEGGMGEVWKAEQQQPLRREVALKLLKAGLDSKSLLARFESERQALALMNHPNIAKVFDAGTTERGRPYFVMEYVRGTALTDYCDAHR